MLHVFSQVDLTSASIRPGQTPEWQAALQDTLQEAVATSTASIKIFTGTWQHDIDQANLLADFKHVNIKVRCSDTTIINWPGLQQQCPALECGSAFTTRQFVSCRICKQAVSSL